MFPYMEEHTTIASPALYYDFDHARELILQKDPHAIAHNAKVSFNDEKNHFTFLSLNQTITVSYPECKATFAETGKSPDLHWHLPLLHYLSTADGLPLSDELMPIRYLDKHIAHPEMFEHETGAKLVRHFNGKSIDRLKAACLALGGELKQSSADLYVKLNFLPCFPVYLQLWLADDELPGSGKMLFDKHCLHYLGEMDIHVCGPLIVRFLIKHYALESVGQEPNISTTV